LDEVQKKLKETTKRSIAFEQSGKCRKWALQYNAT